MLTSPPHVPLCYLAGGVLLLHYLGEGRVCGDAALSAFSELATLVWHEGRASVVVNAPCVLSLIHPAHAW